MLKTLLLRKKIDEKKKLLEEMRAKDADFTKREAEIEGAINEASTEEEQKAVEESVENFETERSTHEQAKADLEKEVGELEEDLRKTEEADEEASRKAAETAEERTVIGSKAPEKREEINSMKTRDLFNSPEKIAYMEREDVKGWVTEIRECIQNKRELTNIGLTIPKVFLGMLKENINNYSKLLKHVNVARINGEGRAVVMGSVPEGIWTECCASLNELSLNFNDVSVDCFKVGGFFKVCNSILEDSDINLAATLLDAIGQAIGLAVDKAILYGRNTSDNYKMPLGVVSRLAQTSKPADYPATARPWVDLHTTNIKTISSSVTGIALFQAIISNSGVMKHRYAKGEKLWVMNETTYTTLQVAAMSINAAGAIVSGMNKTMPVVGGAVELLDFIPDNVIIGGYFELYLLAERAGQKFAQSEHAFFIQDQTAFKGTARYDGLPVIAEAFMVLGINSVTPDATMTFAPDNANVVQNILLNKNTAEVVVDQTITLTATTLPVKGDVTWASSDNTKATVSTSGVVTGKAAGTAVITATSGDASATCTVTVSAGA